ncbi:unnamed protein product [Urochloa humidicola]
MVVAVFAAVAQAPEAGGSRGGGRRGHPGAREAEATGVSCGGNSGAAELPRGGDMRRASAAGERRRGWRPGGDHGEQGRAVSRSPTRRSSTAPPRGLGLRSRRPRRELTLPAWATPPPPDHELRVLCKLRRRKL